MDGCVVRLHAVRFKPNLEGSRGNFIAQPIRVNFRELLGASNPYELVPQVDNRDVLRAVVALIDVSLPDVGPRDIHDTLNAQGAHTIILLRQQEDVLDEYRSRSPHCLEGDPVCSLEVSQASRGTPKPPQPPATADKAPEDELVQVFSDSEASSDDSSVEGEDSPDDRSWELFLSGLQGFLARARERRALREKARTEDPSQVPANAIGIESLIVAVATFELKTLASGDRVLQLSLMATRKRYRRCGVGRYMVELLKSQSVCSTYDALLAHADLDAVNFFSQCGLTDDILLNDQFREVRDEWTNTTLMSYLPPYTTEVESRNPGFALALPQLEQDVDNARSMAIMAYQQQAVCITRMVQEVKTLREQLELQRKEVDNLNDELDKERERRHRVEQQFLEYKLRKTRQLMEGQGFDSDDPDLSTTSTCSSPPVCPSLPLELAPEVGSEL